MALIAYRALETLAMVVVVEGLHPSVPCLDGEPATHALGGEQVVPVWGDHMVNFIIQCLAFRHAAMKTLVVNRLISLLNALHSDMQQ